MSANLIFKLEIVHVITHRKQPILSKQCGLDNIMRTYPQNLDLSSEWGPDRRILTEREFDQRVSACKLFHR